MLNHKGAIFDVDGTLLDSMGVWYDISSNFLKDNGITIPKETLIKYQSMTLEETLPEIHETYLPDMPPEVMINDIKSRAVSAYRHSIPEKKDACRYMRELKKNGVKIAVATSGFEELCKFAFKRLGVADIIDAYAFTSETPYDKSHADVYILAAQRLGLDPKDCVVYEDIVPGIKSAHNAGFCTVAIEDDSNADEKDNLTRYSDYYIKTWAELLD